MFYTDHVPKVNLTADTNNHIKNNENIRFN